MNTNVFETTEIRSRIQRIQLRLAEYFSSVLPHLSHDSIHRRMARKPLFTLALDTNLRVTSLGGVGLKEFGLNAKDIMGRSPGELPNPDLRKVAQLAGHLAQRGIPVYFDYKLEDRWLSIQVKTVHIVIGTMTGIVATAFEVTGHE